MNISTSDLEAVRDLCFEYYANERSNIRCIILYGGAARNFSGENHSPGDFDVNIFFSTQSSVSSTYGMPKVIAEYNGLKVEVMRNRVPNDISIQQYIEEQNSKRWRRIRNEPIIKLYPEIKRVDQ